MGQTFNLVNDRVRLNALNAIRAAPEGYTVTIKERQRSGDQNAFFHALCGDISKSGLEWFGKARSADEWKVLLVSGHTKATQGDVDIVPGLEGEFVNIRESTARMGVKRANSLLEYTLAFCASKGIQLTDTRRQGFLEGREAA